MKCLKPLVKIALLAIGLFSLITWVIGTIIFGDKISSNQFFYFSVWIQFITSPCLLLFYIINVFINKTVAGNKKALWFIFLFLGSLAVFPFYWYLHIWKDNKT